VNEHEQYTTPAQTAARPCSLKRAGVGVGRLWEWVTSSPVVAAAASTGEKGMQSASMFLMTILLGKACSEPVFGAFGITKGVLTLLNLVRHTMVELPLIVFVPSAGVQERPRRLGAAFMLQFILSTGLALGMALAVGVAGVVGTERFFLAALAAVGGASLFVAGRDIARAALYSLHRPRTVFLINSFSRTLLMAGLGVLYWLGYLGPVSAWLLLAACEACAFLAALRYIPLDFRGVRARLEETALRHWRFGRWMAASHGMMWLARTFPVWALGMLQGVGQTAAVFACLALTRPIFLITAPFSNVFLARGAEELVGGGPQALDRYMRVRRLWLLLLVGVLAAGLAAGAGPLLRLVFGEKYAGAGWILRALALQVFIMTLVRTTSAVLVCLRQIRLYFAVHATCGTAALVAFYPVIATCGVRGCVGLMVGIEMLYCILFTLARRCALRRESAAPEDDDS